MTLASAKRFYPFLLTLVILFLDRMTKIAVTTHMRLHESIPFLGDTVRWTYIHNDGMVFGYDVANLSILIVLSVLAVIAVTFILITAKDEPRGMRWILAAILGGAIGNTYDRILYGHVIDFIDVDMPDWLMQRFAIFNVADAAVSVGVTLLLLLMLLKRPTRSELGMEAQVSMRIEEDDRGMFSDLQLHSDLESEAGEKEVQET